MISLFGTSQSFFPRKILTRIETKDKGEFLSLNQTQKEDSESVTIVFEDFQILSVFPLSGRKKNFIIFLFYFSDLKKKRWKKILKKFSGGNQFSQKFSIKDFIIVLSETFRKSFFILKKYREKNNSRICQVFFCLKKIETIFFFKFNLCWLTENFLYKKENTKCNIIIFIENFIIKTCILYDK